MLRTIAGGMLLLIAAACSSAGETSSKRIGPPPSHAPLPAAGPAVPAPPAPAPPATPPVIPAFRRDWLARFAGCDAPVSSCHCDDRVLSVPHQELGPAPKHGADSTQGPKHPMSARVVLLREPEYALALSFGDGVPQGTFMGINLEVPMVHFIGASLEVKHRPEGCWAVIELGDLPFVDPIVVKLSDGSRSEIYELPLQNGVPPAAPPKVSAKQLRIDFMKPAPPQRLAHAHLARQKLDQWHKLKAADLSYADLRKAYLKGVSAHSARLHKARLQRAYLYLSDFPDADFSEADLRGAHLIRSDLRNGNFRGANLAGTRLDHSDLRGADLAHARNLTQAQLDGACGDPDTKLPPGLRIKTCWNPTVSWMNPAPADGDLLVAAPSPECKDEPCEEPCCSTCQHVGWKLAADPNIKVLPERGFELPEYIENMCGLHYDLLAQGRRSGDHFMVRRVDPVPSERLRRAGTPAQLELRALGGNCTTMACFPDDGCCNLCSGSIWSPYPTRDRVRSSGETLPDADLGGCGELFDLAVTGTWLAPNELEVKSVRIVK